MKKNLIIIFSLLVFFNSSFAQQKTEIENTNDVDIDICPGPFIPNPDSLGIYTYLDTMPIFSGCEIEEFNNRLNCTLRKTREFIINNLNYPEPLHDAKVQGKVWVYYEIGLKGQVQNIKILKSVHPKLDLEAKKVIEKLPQYIPGIKNSKAVVVKRTIPVVFKTK